MKKSIISVFFILFSMISFSQEFVKVGHVYEGTEVMEADSILLSELVERYQIDTSGYIPVLFYKDFEKNLDLEKNYRAVSYSLNIINDSKEFYTCEYNTTKQKLGKYIVISEHSFYSGKKYINITIF